MPFPVAASRFGYRTALLSMGAWLLLGAPASANLLTNGDFETGTLLPWTAGGGTVIDTGLVHDGSFAASLGSVVSEPATLEQVVTTTPGSSYTLTFQVLDQAVSVFNSLTVSFGTFSAVITGDTAFDPGGAGGFALESFTIDGASIVGTSTVLRFSAVNELTAFSLDDVVLSTGSTQPPPTVPEPATLLLLPMLAALAAVRLVRPRAA
ncbi:MAG: hypothetical protein JSS43_07705 [Proteobacteria bacterium]|nr:hypothetical protein [Pseudomonadota bacterium]